MHTQTAMNDKNIIFAARVISMVFTPFYLPIVALLALFMLTYLSLLPWLYKALVMLGVYLFTILLPTMLIRLYRQYQGWTLKEIGVKERRMVPYVISIVCYFMCFYLMEFFHVPHFMGSILMAALVLQVLCAIINVWWKISTHTAAIGGVAGALMAFANMFMFNPQWWLCFVLLVAGAVGTSRMILRQHTLQQVVGGFCIGAAAAFLVITII